jgi:pilus assembly protein CpaE
MALKCSIEAFVTTERLSDLLEVMASSPELGRCKLVTHPGGMDKAIDQLSKFPSPELLIIEIDFSKEIIFQKLEVLSTVFNSDSKIILIGNDNDIDLYRKLRALGINEYLFMPETADDLINEIEALFLNFKKSSQAEYIGILGSRGGVGASTLSTNVAHALSQMPNTEVIVVDLDINFGTIALSFDLAPHQSIMDLLKDTGRLDELLLERVMLRHGEQLSIIPAPIAVTQNFNLTGQSIEQLLGLIGSMADYIILDLPHGIPTWQSTIFSKLDQVVLMVYPDLANLRDTKKVFDQIDEHTNMGPRFNFVLNKVGLSASSELSAKEFETVLNLKPIQSVPFDPKLFGKSLNNGAPIVATDKGSKASGSIMKIAQKLSGQEEQKKTSMFMPKFFKKK